MTASSAKTAVAGDTRFLSSIPGVDSVRWCCTDVSLLTFGLMIASLNSRTRIVVTQPEKSRLQHFDRLLLFEDGCIVEMGPPAEVMASWHLEFGTHVLSVPIIIEYNT